MSRADNIYDIERKCGIAIMFIFREKIKKQRNLELRQLSLISFKCLIRN